ncbi:PEGA domain-containing protein [Verrucomicrobiales bacterium]|nr:PEGA domain-containing protein [Verrucomicrobiales bacterium]MDA7926807.1 PEGA domain-containing protein [Verrucomicrobiales bacterium]
MERHTTNIDLPPRRSIRPGTKVPRWGWIVLVLFSLSVGIGGGLYFGKQKASSLPKQSNLPSGVDSSKVTPLIVQAREAVARGEWLEARRHFQDVIEIDQENPIAIASLPLIDRHLDEAKGIISVSTVPSGAVIELKGIDEQTSPARFAGIPMGKHLVRIKKEGFETVERTVNVENEEVIDLVSVELRKTSGGIDVVSEPVGADFKLIKRAGDERKELIEVGKTPARIEKLDPGEYQILMAVEGWPEYSKMVRIENNRNASVSAVFAKGGLNVTSDPNGAELWIQSGDGNARKAGSTPMSMPDLPVGKHTIELRNADWEPIRRTVEVRDGVTQDLEFAWERALVQFVSDPPGAEVFQGGRRLGNGSQVTPFAVEMPEGEYQFASRFDRLSEVNSAAYIDSEAGSNVVNFEFDYGKVFIESDPAEAAVISGGVPLGRTPLTLSVVPPGSYTYELTKAQHRSTRVSGVVEPGGSLDFSASLKFDVTPVMTRNFKNGIGQEMVWFGRLDGWVGAREVTQELFERTTGANPSYFKSPKHPVDSVTWYDAMKFCEALTGEESARGTLPQGYRYRLPSDQEWSHFVGVQKLDGAVSSLFERQKSTAPVGSLAANEFGLYDVRGNVWEWVGDWYSQTIVSRMRKEDATPNESWVGTDRKVLRGGAWNRSSQFDLKVGNRMGAGPSAKDRYDVGFRVVLMRSR